MKPPCFWSSATHRSKTLKSRQAAKAKDLSAASAPIHARPLRLNRFCEASLLVFSAFHRSKTLSSSRQRRQAAKAKDLSAASTPIHARPQRLNLFCEASLLLVSPPITAPKHSVQAAKEDKQQQRRTSLPPQPLFMQDL